MNEVQRHVEIVRERKNENTTNRSMRKLLPTSSNKYSAFGCYFVLLCTVKIICVLKNGTCVLGFTNSMTSEWKNRKHCAEIRTNFARSERLRFQLTQLNMFSPMEVPVVDNLISTYAHCLKYHYYPTQSITNAFLTAVGDGIAQTVQEKDNATPKSSPFSYYDPNRGVVYFLKGLGSGVLWAWWFDFAEVWSMELTDSALSQIDSAFQSLADGIDTKQSISTSVIDSSAFQTFDLLAADDSMRSAPLGEEFSMKTRTVRTVINIALEQFLVSPVVFSCWDIPFTAVTMGSLSSPFEILTQIRQKLPLLFVANAKVWTGVNIVTYNIPLEYRLLFVSAASIVSESINARITSRQNVPGRSIGTSSVSMPTESALSCPVNVTTVAQNA